MVLSSSVSTYPYGHRRWCRFRGRSHGRAHGHGHPRDPGPSCRGPDHGHLGCEYDPCPGDRDGRSLGRGLHDLRGRRRVDHAHDGEELLSDDVGSARDVHHVRRVRHAVGDLRRSASLLMVVYEPTMTSCQTVSIKNKGIKLAYLNLQQVIAPNALVVHLVIGVIGIAATFVLYESEATYALAVAWCRCAGYSRYTYSLLLAVRGAGMSQRTRRPNLQCCQYVARWI